jgi:hypothetical protein
MCRHCSILVFLGLVAATQMGCGTFANLYAPPDPLPPDGLPAIGPTSCVPYGGAARSGIVGVLGTSVAVWGIGEGIAQPGQVWEGGPKEGFRRIGETMGVAGYGVAALIDTPLSLVGDTITWPIAHARQQGHPWATWWGDEARSSAEPNPWLVDPMPKIDQAIVEPD